MALCHKIGVSLKNKQTAYYLISILKSELKLIMPKLNYFGRCSVTLLSRTANHFKQDFNTQG